MRMRKKFRRLFSENFVFEEGDFRFGLAGGPREGQLSESSVAASCPIWHLSHDDSPGTVGEQRAARRASASMTRRHTWRPAIGARAQRAVMMMRLSIAGGTHYVMLPPHQIAAHRNAQTAHGARGGLSAARWGLPAACGRRAAPLETHGRPSKRPPC